jgi:16S rRNA (cytidine1402-2'-O)-methyltransferase
VVATPIGNLGDITLRALETLAAAHIIACEDTRVTAKLLARHGIRTPTTRFDDHNAAQARPRLLARMNGGEAVALVSDAGTPLISDPGYSLVQAVIDASLAVIPIPGPSSVLAALSVAGLPTDRFLFAGFLPPKKPARTKELGGLAGQVATLVFLESPRRLAAALADMAQVFGPRPVTIGRELTKRFEELRRGTLDELAAHYAKAGAPKGEVVIVVGGAGPAPPPADDHVRALLAEALKTISVREAVKQVTGQTGLSRRRVYALALTLTSK